MTRRGKLISASGLCAGVIAIILTWPHIAIETLSALSGSIVWRANITEPIIAISFDDGPDPVYTPQVLRILSDKDVKATFFLVGERAHSYPHLVAAIRANGHEIANHSDTWHRTLTLPLDQFEQDLLRAETTLGLTGEKKKFFRPAGVWARPNQIRVAKQRGYTVVLGSAYAFDPLKPPSGFIAWEIARALRPGAIIVLHDSGGDRTNTVKALPRIIEVAKARRLEFVTMSRLL
jgi:peptidoglycan-N-acetylglucosamine deacetylase